MKIIKVFMFYVAPLLIGIVVGLSVFFPWQDVCELAFLKSSSMAAKRGLEIKADSFEKNGLLPAFTIKGFSIKYFMGGADFKEVHLIPQLTASIIKKSPVLKVELDTGKIELSAMVDKQLSGAFFVSVKNDILNVNRLNLTGDISVKGDVSLSVKTKKILAANVKIKVPEEMSAPMNTLRNMLPLNRKPDGSWLLSRKGHKK